jgi:capsular exopolysaccharide synthesis family protein
MVLANLSAMPTNKQSSVIDLRLKDEVPKRAEVTLSDLVDAYNTASVDRKNGVAQKTLQFIDARLKKVGQELDSMESNVQKFRDRTGIVDITEQSRLYLQRVEDNDKQINSMDMQLAAMDEVEKYVTSKSGTGSIAPAGLAINDPSLNGLVQKLSQDESQLEKLKRTTAENNPILQGIQDDIAKTKPAILDNIRNQRQSLVASRNQLARTSSARSSALSTIPQRERELVEATRQTNIKSQIYAFLLQKREETAYSISSALPDAYLVSNPTTANKPVSPVVPLLVLLATLIPVALGVLYVTLKDMMNGRILYRTDIQKLSTFPVIGEIIQEKGVDPLVVAKDGRTFIVEQFRLMRAALKHLGTTPGKYRRIMVTSSVKGEGKSFVSTNIALSLARSGKTVALLEMDLHQPRITDMVGWEVKVGITDYLNGAAGVDDIVYKSDLNANLSLVPAGHLHEDVSEMLTDKKLSDLIGQLEKKFDFVIIDTPPIRIITDAYLIAQHVDLVLFVVRHDVTHKGLLELLDEDMASHNIENLAFVFNGVKQRGYGKIKYGYGYGYGHASKTSYDTYGKNKKGKRA